MNILINFSTLKKGGGQNVALNFLHALFDFNETNNSYYFLVVENSPIHQFLKQNNQHHILVTSSSPIKRVFKEFFFYSSVIRRLKIDIIYTYFGYALFRGKTPQICGVAVSNVFFPEIKFWEGNLLKVTIRKLIDKYRIYGIKKATALIFENEEMEDRSHSLFHIHRNRTIYIPPSFSPNFEQEELNIPELDNYSIKLLMLCGWHLNKNIMKVPEIAYNLKKRKNNFQFIITAPRDNSKLHKEFLSLINRYEVNDMIFIIGPVKKQQLKSLYDQVDFVLLMSKLESFSNNIIEAWYFKKPLIISDEEWAHSICKNAAYFINRESPQEIAASIQDLQSNLIKQNELIKEGQKQIKNYPSVTEKTRREITFIEKIYNELKS